MLKDRNILFLKDIILLPLFLCLLVTLPMRTGFAETATAAAVPTSCNPDYLKTLTDKAMGEMERNGAIDNAALEKPANSVLTLSCFDKTVSQISKGGAVFSDTQGNTDGTKVALDKIGGGTWNEFLLHNYAKKGEDTTIATDISANSETAARPCDAMAKEFAATRSKALDRNLIAPLDVHASIAKAGYSIGSSECPEDEDGACPNETAGNAKNLGAGANASEEPSANPADLEDDKTGAAGTTDANGKTIKCEDHAANPTGSTRTTSEGTFYEYECTVSGCDAPDDVPYDENKGDEAPVKKCITPQHLPGAI